MEIKRIKNEGNNEMLVVILIAYLIISATYVLFRIVFFEKPEVVGMGFVYMAKKT